jgi:ParB family chromosome partitioning protein
MLMGAMDSEQGTPSLSQAQRLKKFSQEGHLTEDSMLAIMSEEKKSDLDKVTLSGDKLKNISLSHIPPSRWRKSF